MCIVCTEDILTEKLHVCIIYACKYVYKLVDMVPHGTASYGNTKIGATSEH